MGCSAGWSDYNYGQQAPRRPVVEQLQDASQLVEEYTWEVIRSRVVKAATPEDALKKAITTPVLESDEEWRVRCVGRTT